MAYRFQKLLESATEQTLVEPNWEGILECVDMIRGGESPLKEAVKAIQKRYHNPNPHVAHHALLVLEACVKNCGKKFILEVATKDFMDDLKTVVISNPPENVRTKVLELIQCWTSAFKGIPEYKIVGETHTLLKMNGFEFPPIDEAKAMFLAESAPDWAEGDNCYRCRAEFGVFTRKHHCRACGQIFCDKCSGKQMFLPQYGIEKKVRVCESCFDKKQTQVTQKTKPKNDELTEDASTREKAKKEAEAKEQEELELALAISKSEAEEQDRLSRLYNKYNLGSVTTGMSSATVQPVADSIIGGREEYQQQTTYGTIPTNANAAKEELTLAGGDDPQEQPFDSMLAKYLDRDYWERKRRETETQPMQLRATAPPPSEVSVSVSSSVSQQQPQENGNGHGLVSFGGRNALVEQSQQPSTAYELSNQQQHQRQSSNDALTMVGGIPPMTTEEQHQHQQQVGTVPTGGQQLDELARLYSKMNMTAVVGDNTGADEGADEVAETSQFCRILKDRADTMSTRMRSNHLRGRSIVNDSAIHTLFSQLTDLHAAVLQRMAKLEGQREHYERLQDHLAHIQEARQAINVLREENERQRQDRLKEEQNRRQVQLRQKLELMRHKKHEMLLFERQAAIQRFQEHERQILQQRMGQQPSPQTVVGGAHNQQAANNVIPMPMHSSPVTVMPQTTATLPTSISQPHQNQFNHLAAPLPQQMIPPPMPQMMAPLHHHQQNNSLYQHGSSASQLPMAGAHAPPPPISSYAIPPVLSYANSHLPSHQQQQNHLMMTSSAASIPYSGALGPYQMHPHAPGMGPTTQNLPPMMMMMGQHQQHFYQHNMPVAAYQPPPVQQQQQEPMAQKEVPEDLLISFD